ncbi:MAG TPA: ribosomal L7Ae/L30e/S12e/Gadd45 family protein [Gemmatimonadota bacterium]|nr:ribosomal L7Ae/L30e/S12e/Gadd45 family protein [Gemmatimonadota bacterium]
MKRRAGTAETTSRARAERVPEALKPRVAGLLRQARRAGRIIVGIALTKQCVRDGRARAIWIADDLSDRREASLLDRWGSAGIRIYSGWTKEELGDLAGKPAVAVLSVTDLNIAAGISQILAAAVSNEERGGERG